MAFFSDFQYGFWSSWSIADLLKMVSDKIARAFSRSRATRAVALDISNAFDRVWRAGLLHKLKSYGISGQILSLLRLFSGYKVKYSCFRKCGWREKFSPWRPQNYFFKINLIEFSTFLCWKTKSPNFCCSKRKKT